MKAIRNTPKPTVKKQRLTAVEKNALLSSLGLLTDGRVVGLGQHVASALQDDLVLVLVLVVLGVV